MLVYVVRILTVCNLFKHMSSRAHPRTGSVQTSPSSTPLAGRRGRQLPQLPPKGSLDRKNGDKEIENFEEEERYHVEDQCSEVEAGWSHLSYRLLSL
ncbi:hypothetical protein GDO81_011188 [Engystomops pustulosus]|uniref:Uncharacterized protein n=1 Tax=Engystomops pustulosus TaxID=76066 RepID=A0AAV7BCM2_ENGPU|nr:hypothetical protein GDO81_011188 [Engystomops pustulosus]